METFFILSIINIFGAVGTIIWSFIELFIAFTGFYQIFHISGTKIPNIYSKVYKSSISNNDLPSGWIVGKWFIGFNNSEKLYILMSIKQYNIIFKNCQDSDPVINFLERDGTYYNIFYNDRKIKLLEDNPRPKQHIIINKMIQLVNIKQNCITFVSGPSGTGKSLIAHLLCKQLITEGASSVYLVDTHNPSDPGDSFVSLYSRIEPTANSPLVVVFEEIDILIEKMFTGIQSHKLIPIAIQNKMGWNQYFDRFNRGIYPHVYILMTSNKDIKWFTHKCPSLMREGRIDLIETLNDESKEVYNDFGWALSENKYNIHKFL